MNEDELNLKDAIILFLFSVVYLIACLIDILFLPFTYLLKSKQASTWISNLKSSGTK